MAAGNTYVALATNTLTTTTASVTFSSISGSYTDLVLIVTGQGVFTLNDYLDVGIQFNGDTGSNYSTTQFRGDGVNKTSERYSSEARIRAAHIRGIVTASTEHSTFTINFMNYSNATTYKTTLSRSGTASTNASITAKVGLWRSTSAITSILIKNDDSASGFHTGTTFSLYGIAAA